VDIFEFMHESPFNAFMLIICLSQLILHIIVTLPNRIMRHWNIRKHGYPPPHCDADGDFRETPEDD